MFPVLVFVAALAAGSAEAVPPAQTAASPAAAPAEGTLETQLKPGQERVKVRCREETATGSRFSKRRCWRLDDLARAEEDAKAAAREITRHPSLPPGSN
jgi:hypothetical protein